MDNIKMWTFTTLDYDCNPIGKPWKRYLSSEVRDAWKEARNRVIEKGVGCTASLILNGGTPGAYCVAVCSYKSTAPVGWRVLSNRDSAKVLERAGVPKLDAYEILKGE